MNEQAKSPSNYITVFSLLITVDWATTLLHANVSSTIEWTALTFLNLRINADDYDDPLTFMVAWECIVMTLEKMTKLMFVVLSKMSCADMLAPLEILINNYNNSDDPLAFPQFLINHI